MAPGRLGAMWVGLQCVGGPHWKHLPPTEVHPIIHPRTVGTRAWNAIIDNDHQTPRVRDAQYSVQFHLFRFIRIAYLFICFCVWGGHKTQGQQRDTRQTHRHSLAHPLGDKGHTWVKYSGKVQPIGHMRKQSGTRQTITGGKKQKH